MINGGSIFGFALLTAMVILVGVITGVIAIGLAGTVMDMTIHGKVLFRWNVFISSRLRGIGQRYERRIFGRDAAHPVGHSSTAVADECLS